MHAKTFLTLLTASLGFALGGGGSFGAERFLVLNDDFDVTCIADQTGDTVFGEVVQGGIVKSVHWNEVDGLTVIADGANDTHVVACSGDGSVAVGYLIRSSLKRPFRWTAGTGLVELTSPITTTSGQATDCSADGSIVVGSFDLFPENFNHVAFLWTQSAGTTLIPPLGVTQYRGNVATSCSDSGVVFGWSYRDGSTAGSQAPFRYSIAGGVSYLAATGDAPIGPATQVLGSADGTAAAVLEDRFVGNNVGTSTWRQGAPYKNVGYFVSDYFIQGTTARCISDDGNVVAGDARIDSTTNRHAFRWSPAGGLEDIGTLGGASSSATAVTGDGEHLYGTADSLEGNESFVWERTGGMRSLKTYAQGRLPAATEMADWRFGEVVVSRDGHRMFVEGTRTDNLSRILFLDIEPPVNTPPEIDPISPVVLECVDRVHTVSLSSLVDDFDGQSMTVRWKVDGQVRKTTAGVAPGSPVEFTFGYGHGVHSVVVEATDGFETTTVGTTVTVQDTVAPVIVVAADAVVPTDPGKAVATGVTLEPPTAQDASGHTVTLTNDAPTAYPLGDTIVTWTGRDIDGNTATGTQKVTVQDREAPKIAAPASVRRFCDPGKLFSSFALPVPQATDNVSVGVQVTGNPKPLYPIGTTRVTWSAVDEAGNAASQATNLVVVNRVPRANAGKNVVLTANSEKGIRVQLDGSKSSDPDRHPLKFRWTAPRVKLAGVTARKAAGVFPVGTTNVKLTVTDAAGAKHTDSVRVTVKLKNSKRRPRGTQANEAFAQAARTSERLVSNGEVSASSFAAYQYAQAAEGLGVAAGDLIVWNESGSPLDASLAYAELRQRQTEYGEQAARALLASFAESGDEEALAAAMDALLGTLYAGADLSEE